MMGSGVSLTGPRAGDWPERQSEDATGITPITANDPKSERATKPNMGVPSLAEAAAMILIWSAATTGYTITSVRNIANLESAPAAQAAAVAAISQACGGLRAGQRYCRGAPLIAFRSRIDVTQPVFKECLADSDTWPHSARITGLGLRGNLKTVME